MLRVEDSGGEGEDAFFGGFDLFWVVEERVILALVPGREHVAPVLAVGLAGLASGENCQRLIPIAHVEYHPVGLVRGYSIWVEQLEPGDRHGCAVAAER